MKLSPAQHRAMSLMRKTADGKIKSSDAHRVTRSTVEALARIGLVEVMRTMHEREIKHRNGKRSLVMQCSWTAQIKPVRPETEELEELDLIAGSAQRTLRPDQRTQAAAYVALYAPHIALDRSPARSPGYSVCDAYARLLDGDDAALIGQYRTTRHLNGTAPLVPDPRESLGRTTDIWLLHDGTDTRDGKELGRVEARSAVTAAHAGNSLLNRRGGYRMRRLREREITGWVKDMRGQGVVLRLEAAPGGGFQVSTVADGQVLTHRDTAREAERDALADLVNLMTVFGPRHRLAT